MMSENDVGYKKPPRHSQFKAGNRANPKGRGARKVSTEADILKNLMNFPVEFRQGGKAKRAPRIELVIERFGTLALQGDISAAAMLLKMRRDAGMGIVVRARARSRR
jgi:hypothetical protein